MAGAMMQCKICFYNFNEDEKMPRMLPCSHSFCQQCLVKQQFFDRQCSLCYADWNTSFIHDLPYCYQLIPGTGLTKILHQSEISTCEKHQQRVVFWCKSCEEDICKICFKDAHIACDWVIIKEKDEESSKDGELQRLQKDDGVQTPPKKMSKVITSRLPAKQASQNIIQEIVEYKVQQLLDGEVWVIADNTNLIEGLHLMTETSARPRHVELIGIGWPIEVEEFLKTFTNKKYEVQIHLKTGWTEDELEQFSSLIKPLEVNYSIYSTYWNPAEDTTEMCLKRLLNLTKCFSAGSLREFWGNMACAQSFFYSLEHCSGFRRIGLALWTSKDLSTQVVHKLCNANSKRVSNRINCYAYWINLPHLDLYIGKTFQVNEGTSQVGERNGLPASRFIHELRKNRKHVALHFPFLLQEDFSWMTSVILFLIGSSKGIDKDTSVIKRIYLPGAKLNPDIFLGALKDLLIRCTVHLPLGLTPDCHRAATVKRYRAADCDVVWDQQKLPFTNEDLRQAALLPRTVNGQAYNPEKFDVTYPAPAS